MRRVGAGRRLARRVETHAPQRVRLDMQQLDAEALRVFQIHYSCHTPGTVHGSRCPRNPADAERSYTASNSSFFVVPIATFRRPLSLSK